MDIRYDPSTTATTDYDSGDSEGVDYVYEGHTRAESRSVKRRNSREKSPKAKPRRVARCTCGADMVDGDAEVTVFEEDSDIDDQDGHRRRPRNPSLPGSLEGPACRCNDKEHHRPRKLDRQATASKTRREQSPYIEEYPDDAPRPVIFLKEHRISRRSLSSDAKRVLSSEDCSLPPRSRGRSPAGNRLPLRPSRRRSKDTRQHSRHRKRCLAPHRMLEGKLSNSEARHFQSDFGEPGPASRRLRHEVMPEPVSVVSRSSAWDGSRRPEYSSSWPLHAGTCPSHKRLGHRDGEYDTEEDIERAPLSHGDPYHEHHHSRHNRSRSSSKRAAEGGRKREPPVQEPPPPQCQARHEHERRRLPLPRLRSRTVISAATTDQGYRSVATSLCEVWRGQADDWESPYASASEDDFDPDVDEPIPLLRMEDMPPRRSSPRLLPPRGERRDFGFQPTNPYPPPYLHRPFTYTDDQHSGTHPGIHHNPTCPMPFPRLPLLDGPHLFIMERDAMTDEDDDDHHDDIRGPSPSRASPWPRPGPPPPDSSRLDTTALSPPRSHAVSSVFSARRTREFLSPKPTRAARINFGAWG